MIDQPAVAAAFRPRIFSLLLTLALSATVYLSAQADANATSIVYDLSGVTATFNADVLTLSGSFTYDTTGNDLTAINITVTEEFPGYVLPSATNVFTDPTVVTIGSDRALNIPDAFTLTFFSPLADDSTDQVQAYADTASGTTSIGRDASLNTGDAIPSVPTSVVPEPPSVALLGGALGLILLTLRLNRRGRWSMTAT